VKIFSEDLGASDRKLLPGGQDVERFEKNSRENAEKAMFYWKKFGELPFKKMQSTYNLKVAPHVWRNLGC